MALPKSREDREQRKFVENTDGDVAVRVLNFGDLIPDSYDYIALTYVAAGNGAGQIETVTYKTGGASGTTIAVLTLAYNGDNNLSSVTKA